MNETQIYHYIRYINRNHGNISAIHFNTLVMMVLEWNKNANWCLTRTISCNNTQDIMWKVVLNRSKNTFWLWKILNFKFFELKKFRNWIDILIYIKNISQQNDTFEYIPNLLLLNDFDICIQSIFECINGIGLPNTATKAHSNRCRITNK